ncbi:MAG TPA: hypothetical protein ENO22_04940 [candidate division Zixibacteria bacterium]|nr:hypothetical protein [candidate division Zixibacteria bacterium]
MKKTTLAVCVFILFIFAANLTADPVTTTRNFWSAVFEEGDLKLAFSYLAAEDQEFIKTNAPDVYGLIMGDVGDLGGEVGAIFTAFQKIILNTVGKVIKIEDVREGARVDNGQEVFYSMTLAADIDSYLELAKWIEERGKKFEDPADTTPMMEKVQDFINDLSQKLDNLSYKTSLSWNSFVTVINENGQEKLLLNLAMQQEKFKMLDENFD